MNKIVIATIGMAFAVMLTVSGIVSVNAQSTTGSVYIEPTCGFSVPTGIAFGNVLRNATSASIPVNFTNNGSVTAATNVTGSDWLGNTPPYDHIKGNYTKFATSEQGNSTAYASRYSLNATNAEVTLGNIVPPYNQTYWQLFTELYNFPFNGTLTQNITFTSDCIAYP